MEPMASEAVVGEQMKKAKTVGSIFALPILLIVKTCELIFVLPVKAVAKAKRKWERRNKQ